MREDDVTLQDTMTESNNIIKQLGFDGVLLSMQETLSRYPNYQDIVRLGADECYFISGHPAALFCRTNVFDDEYAKRVSGVLHNAWNYQKVMLLISYSDFEVRVYNCYTKPGYVERDAEFKKEIEEAQIGVSSLQDSDLGSFISFFSREAIDTGALWYASEEAKKIDVSKRVDAYLVESLDRTKTRLMQDGLPERYVHALLIRSLFVLFLEDKGATNKAGIYSTIMPGSSSFFDILLSKRATYNLFSRLKSQFNGDITQLSGEEKYLVKQKHLDIIRKCFLDGDLSDQPKMFGDWRLFHFDIIRIELLSEIYEHFLGTSRASKGQYYTPSNLVNLILNEKIAADSKRWDLRVLDPACGSGIFLVESYKRLIEIWKKENGKEKIDFQTLRNILCKSIIGIDIDETALSVTAFSLYLTLINELDPKTLWADPSYKLPYLIHHEGATASVEGNLWCADAIATDFTAFIPVVDLVVGNPPYGTKHDQQSISDYCKAQGFADEMSIPFMHKVASICPQGEIALVINMKVLTNSNGTYSRFRDWLLRTAYVEKIYNFSVFRNAPISFGGSLFASARTPVAVVFYRASRPVHVSQSIIYWAPKTYVKSSMLYDIVLDSCDIKALPRGMCEQNDASVWKLGAWGNALAYRLATKFRKAVTLEHTFKKLGWVYGRGYNADSRHPDVIPKSIIDLRRIQRYHIAEDATINNEKDKAYRRVKTGLFDAPFVLMKECPDKDGIIAGLFTGNAISNTSTFVFNGMSDSDKIVLSAYLNSRFANVIIFLTSSTWGIERERLLLEDEVMLLPSPFELVTEEQRTRILQVTNCIYKKQTEFWERGIDKEVRELDKLFYSIFNLTKLEIEILDDIYENSLKFFALKEDSLAMARTTRQSLSDYAERLCESLNDYYRYSNTRVSPVILNPLVADPLCMVSVQFGDKGGRLRVLDGKEDRLLLRKLYRILASKPSDGVVIQRVLRDYQPNSITLIKPNQKRYWTEMQAIEDGASIFSEVLSMRESHNG